MWKIFRLGKNLEDMCKPQRGYNPPPKEKVEPVVTPHTPTKDRLGVDEAKDIYSEGLKTGLDLGRRSEQERIVKFLRFYPMDPMGLVTKLANDIEQGKHND